MPTFFVPDSRRTPDNLFTADDFARQRAFFAGRPELRATPLHRASALARHLGVGELLVKNETARFGLNAFKAAGATFAFAALQERGELRPGDLVVCASEGNHGRAVARAAREAGCRATVYMSDRVSPARVEAIRGEGAEVVLVEGSYDDAVRRMAAEAASRGLLVVSDTSWPGYTEIPRLIVLGYTRLLDEFDATPDVIFVPAGVGGLLAAVASWCDFVHGPNRPRVVAVEPLSAACVLTSVRAGTPTSLSGPFPTVMGGLRCGEMSPDTFPAIASLVDAFVAIEDEFAFEAMRLLARPAPPDTPVNAGPSGAAALGGLLATVTAADLEPVREALQLGRESRVAVLVSEGVTDPALFAEVLARG